MRHSPFAARLDASRLLVAAGATLVAIAAIMILVVHGGEPRVTLLGIVAMQLGGLLLATRGELGRRLPGGPRWAGGAHGRGWVESSSGAARGLVGVLTAAWGLGAFGLAMVPPLGPPPLAADRFDREVSGGWDRAASGGEYRIARAPGDFAVAGGAGLMVLPDVNAARRATLAEVSGRDVDLVVRVAADRSPRSLRGGGLVTYLLARRQPGGAEYRARARLSPNGGVYLDAAAYDPQGGTAALGPEVRVAGLGHVAGRFVWLRARVEGGGPSTVRLKAWQDGQAEPADWPYVATDRRPSLQRAGMVGLEAAALPPEPNAPAILYFDDLAVTGTGGA